jgi:surfactin synthase thioesterase subunit
MDVDWFNTCEEQPERMRNLAKELRLALFPQVSARKFRNWSTEAQREVDSCLLLALNGHHKRTDECPLSGAKRTLRNLRSPIER